ncbi:zinc-binding dehydrogenase [Streptomyces sp. NBC_01511]|uniref:zinc-binding dehydrogenase n=1 Tax=Streptomyces sp. NBC_01511 TaxID=2903889 RepID=UPI0038640C57
MPAAATALLPDGLDPVDAPSLPPNALTAAQMVHRIGPANGRSLLVTGAAGAVGGYAAALHAPALVAIRDGGTFVGVTTASPATPERDIGIVIMNVAPDGTMLAELLALAASGVLELRVAGRVPLREATTAYDKVAAGGQRGRWLLIP